MQSFSLPNYSGLLFNKGNTRTPLISAISPKRRYSDSVEFVMGQEYATGGGSQPNISETASLTAPDPSFITTSQKTNVTQIYQESFGISDAKLSNMGTLSGINVAGQVANPINPLDFQTAGKMAKIARDTEYTFINGTYNKATSDSEVNKTRGLVSAITTNTIDLGGKPLGFWDIAMLQKKMYENNAPVTDLVVWGNTTSIFQLNADAEQYGYKTIDAGTEINGIKLTAVMTPFGIVYLRMGEFVPAGTTLILNLGALAPVENIVPGKGNFYREQLAKTGAGETYMIFGQVGLDYGMEWLHGKFTNGDTTFTKPDYSKPVYLTAPAGVVETTATITGATLNKSTVAADDTAKVAVASTTYTITPTTAPTLAYQWQIRAKTGTVWNNLTSDYTGYNTSELTVKAADAEKHYRCVVTATGSVTGSVNSDECTVNAAG